MRARRRAAGAALVVLSLLLCSPTAYASGLNQSEQLVVDSITADRAYNLALLDMLASINSGSRNAQGIVDVADLLVVQLEPLGFTVTREPGGVIEQTTCPTNPSPVITTAPHIVAKRTGDRGKRLLLSAHMDTVFEPDSGFLETERVGDTMHGPGVVDCKGGIAVLITALRAMHWNGSLDNTTITIVLNSDEELGSLTSRPILEREAKAHDMALVFEGAVENNGRTTVTTSRKGLGQFHVVVEGRAAHAGVDHKHGVNALEELAGYVLDIQGLTDYETGTTLNVGNIQCPGCKRNIVPGCVEASVDLRYVDVDAGRRVQDFMNDLGARARVHAADDALATRTLVWGMLHRPAWNPTPDSTELRDLVMRAGDDLGLPLVSRRSGGGSDANLIAAVGCPVIDGLGPVGSGVHTHEETLQVSTLTTRAQLAAVTMMRLLARSRMAGTPVAAIPVALP